MEDVENNERELKNKNTKGKKRDEADPGANGVLDLALIKTDPDKLYPLIYYALKRTLKEWGEAMDERPGLIPDPLVSNIRADASSLEHVKRTTQGKLAAATQVQSAEYLKPLFKTLRSRVSVIISSYISPLTFQKVFTSRHACSYGRNRASHAEKAVSTCKRFLLETLDWERTLADWCYYGWVGQKLTISYN